MPVPTEIAAWKKHEKLNREEAQRKQEAEERRKQALHDLCAGPMPKAVAARLKIGCGKLLDLLKGEGAEKQLPTRSESDDDVPEPVKVDGKVIYPADWPTYDLNGKPCQPHKNQVSRLQMSWWKEDCEPSTFPPPSRTQAETGTNCQRQNKNLAFSPVLQFLLTHIHQQRSTRGKRSTTNCSRRSSKREDAKTMTPASAKGLREEEGEDTQA